MRSDNTTDSGTLVIKKATASAALTGTASKTYDGTAIADYQGQYTITLNEPGNPTYTLTPDDLEFSSDGKTWTKTAPVNADTYQVRLSADGWTHIKAINSDNVSWPTNADAGTATYTINAANVTTTLGGSGSMTYSGKAATTSDLSADGSTIKVTINTTITNAPTTFTLRDGDYTWNTADGKAPTNAGTYTITLTQTGLDKIQAAIDSAVGKGNVVLTSTTDNAGSAKFTINQAIAENVTLYGNESKTYDGTAASFDPTNADTLKNFGFNNVQGLTIPTFSSEDFSWYDANDNEIDAPTNAGTYYLQLNAKGKKALADANPNYSFVDKDGKSTISGKITYTIKQADLVITVSGSAWKVYDGQNAAITQDDIDKGNITLIWGNQSVKPSDLGTLTLAPDDFEVVDANGNPVSAANGYKGDSTSVTNPYHVKLSASGLAKIQALTGANNYIISQSTIKDGQYVIYARNALVTISGSQSTTYGVTAPLNENDFTIDFSNWAGSDKPTIDLTDYYKTNTSPALYIEGYKNGGLPTNVGSYNVHASDSLLTYLRQKYPNYIFENLTNSDGTVVTTALPSGSTEDVDTTHSPATYNITPAVTTVTINGAEHVKYGESTDIQYNTDNGYTITITAPTGTNGQVTNEKTPVYTTFKLDSGDLEFVKTPGDVGSYQVKLSAQGLQKLSQLTGSSNYDWTQAKDVTANFYVDQMPTTITVAGDKTVTYGDSDWSSVTTKDPKDLGYTLTITNSDGKTLTYHTQAGDLVFDKTPGNAGSYTVKLSDTGLQDIERALGTNYSYVKNASDVTTAGTLTINKATATVNITGTQTGTDTAIDSNNFSTTAPSGVVIPTGLVYEFVNGTPTTSGTYDIALSSTSQNTLENANPNYTLTISSNAKFNLQATLNIIFQDKDESDQQVGQPITKTGMNGDQISLDFSSQLPKGYVLATNAPTSYTFTGDLSQTLYVPLVHGTKTISHTDPAKTGDTTDSGQPINGATDSDLNKTVTRTINVTDPSGKTSTTTQTVNLYRDATVDEVTGKVTYGKWNTGSWDEYQVPSIAGYTPSQASVAKDDVTSDTQNSTIKIAYTANDQTTHINYVDANGNVIKTDTINGKTDQTVQTNSLVPNGWKLVDGQTIPDSITFKGASTPDTTVTIEHATRIVDHTAPVKTGDKTDSGQPINGATDSDLNKTVTRTIKITDQNGKTTTTMQTAKVHRDATVDEVTGDVTYGKWSTDSFAEFDDIPTIAGYTPSQSSVEKESVTSDSKDETVNISYTANRQTTHIKYVDAKGNVIKTDTINGKTDQTVKTNGSVPAGWVIDGNGSVPTEITFHGASTPDTTITVKHGTRTVQPDNPVKDNEQTPTGKVINGAHEGDLNKTITRTVNITDPVTGKTSTTTQSVHLTRTATVDNVTGEVTYGDWTSGKFDSVDVPAVKGYTPNQSLVPEENVTSETQSGTVTITYTANKQTGKINYVDQDGNTISSQTISDKTGTDITITPQVPTGWVATTAIPKTVHVGQDGVPTTTVTIKHGTTTVQPGAPIPDGGTTVTGKTINGAHESDLNKIITRTINITNPVTGKTTQTQTVHLTRTATVDNVTGDVTYGKWTTGSFKQVDVPAITGYTPSQSTVPAENVTANSQDETVNITYSANTQTTHINYVDGSGKVIKTDTITGRTGETVPVKADLPAGWQLANGTKVPSQITFSGTGAPDVTVKIEHATKTIDHTDPVKPSDKTDSGQPIKGATDSDLNKTVTRTINVTDPSGRTTSVEQTIHLYRDATVDEVTGDVTYGQWSTGSWAEYDVPTIAGYTPSQANVPAEAVNIQTPDSTVNITYTANDQTTHIRYVDGNGNVIKTDTVTGKTGQTVRTNSTVPVGWVIDGNATVPATITFDGNGTPDVTITIKHGTTTVQPGAPIANGSKTPTGQPINGAHASDLNKTVTRTINITDPVTNQTTTQVQTVHLTRTATVDEVTGEVTYGSWTTGSFGEVVVPTIDGYTPSQATVPAEAVNSTTADSVVNITYTGNEQTITINYVDKDGNVIQTYVLRGRTGETVRLPHNLPAGWVFVDNVPDTIVIRAGVVRLAFEVAQASPSVPVNPNQSQSQGQAGTDHSQSTGTTSAGQSVVNANGQAQQGTTANQAAARLPQTGNRQNGSAALLGVGLVGLLGMLGFKKRRHD